MIDWVKYASEGLFHIEIKPALSPKFRTGCEQIQKTNKSFFSIANTFGQFGPEMLRFLWALADFAARNRILLPRPLLPRSGPAAQAAA